MYKIIAVPGRSNGRTQSNSQQGTKNAYQQVQTYRL
jgi:hypothetical protein